MRTVITYGTFDVLHLGHVNILRLAKSLGDKLIVGLSTDEFNKKKSKRSIYSYEERKSMLESIRYVDFVVPECTWEQKISDISNYEVDVFVMGGDWRGRFDYLTDYCEVVYFDRTEGISSTIVKQKLTCF